MIVYEHQDIEYYKKLKSRYWELKCAAIKRGWGFDFCNFEEFKKFMIANNYEYGMNIMRYDLLKPFSVDNCYLSHTRERLFEGKTLKEWGEILKLAPNTVYGYLLKGKNIQDLLKTHPRKMKKGHPLLRTWGNIKTFASEKMGMEIGWKDFWDFVGWSEANGWSPGKQLVRKFKDEGYTKDNCCWSYRKCLPYRYKNRSMFFHKLKKFYENNEEYKRRHEGRKESCRKYHRKLRYKLSDINQRRHNNVQIAKQNDPLYIANDPYLSMYLKAATDTKRTSFIGLPEVFEDIRAVIPTMTPDRGRALNPKFYPLPDKWHFCQILNKVDHKDPEEFQNRIADILFWTLPFAGNPVSCITLRRTEDYLIQTKEETGQYTLDLFADDAVADVLGWHKFWEKPETDDEKEIGVSEYAFTILKDMKNNGHSYISEEYLKKHFTPYGVTKIINTLITSGLMDNTDRRTDSHDRKLSLSCLGESFMNVIDSLPGKTNYIYFKNYDMSFRFALCERIAKQIVADGYDFYMSIEKTERAEKRSYKVVKKDKEPLNIWEKPEEIVIHVPPKVEINEVIDDQPIEFDDEDTYSEDDHDFFNPPENVKIVEITPEVKNIRAYPKALNEQEVKEEMYRPMSSSSETEENKSYTSNLAPRPPFVPPQDPLVLARDTDKVDEDRVLTLSQSITEFMVKEKSNLPPNVKTALKEALMALMEL